MVGIQTYKEQGTNVVDFVILKLPNSYLFKFLLWDYLITLGLVINSEIS